jgi:hypothetical protein
MLSLSMTFEYDQPILPPRPISGPEIPDMMAVIFLCCENQGKILDGWRYILTCPFCGMKCEMQ